MSGISFAAMPNDTIVLKEQNKAMELSKIDIDTLLKEVSDDNKADLYYKVMDSWINVDTGKFVNASDIPQVTYVSDKGSVIYEAGDGDEVTDSFYIKNID